MSKMCPLSSCKYCSSDGLCMNENMKQVKNDSLSASKGISSSECIDCFESK